MENYKIQLNPQTNLWDIHEKCSLEIGKLTWVILKLDFPTAGAARNYLREHHNV